MAVYEYKAADPETFTQASVMLYNSDGSFLSIPCDPANSDYQRYLRWLEDPNADEFQPPLEG